jgi:hypothetical protein
MIDPHSPALLRYHLIDLTWVPRLPSGSTSTWRQRRRQTTVLKAGYLVPMGSGKWWVVITSLITIAVYAIGSAGPSCEILAIVRHHGWAAMRRVRTAKGRDFERRSVRRCWGTPGRHPQCVNARDRETALV